jgi:hypothetical protein
MLFLHRYFWWFVVLGLAVMILNGLTSPKTSVIRDGDVFTVELTVSETRYPCTIEF